MQKLVEDPHYPTQVQTASWAAGGVRVMLLRPGLPETKAQGGSCSHRGAHRGVVFIHLAWEVGVLALSPASCVTSGKLLYLSKLQ